MDQILHDVLDAEMNHLRKRGVFLDGEKSSKSSRAGRGDTSTTNKSGEGGKQGGGTNSRFVDITAGVEQKEIPSLPFLLGREGTTLSPFPARKERDQRKLRRARSTGLRFPGADIGLLRAGGAEDIMSAPPARSSPVPLGAVVPFLSWLEAETCYLPKGTQEVCGTDASSWAGGAAPLGGKSLGASRWASVNLAEDRRGATPEDNFAEDAPVVARPSKNKSKKQRAGRKKALLGKSPDVVSKGASSTVEGTSSTAEGYQQTTKTCLLTSSSPSRIVEKKPSKMLDPAAPVFIPRGANANVVEGGVFIPPPPPPPPVIPTEAQIRDILCGVGGSGTSIDSLLGPPPLGAAGAPAAALGAALQGLKGPPDGGPPRIYGLRIVVAHL